ncbi:DedA family protein [Actinoplanes sp. TBRC 11911]|uniref:DedA family protein n=1 Tax=Actinoplanes sp. TBRC 11911 TaxID=2729386 RepID=UPI00145E3C85|nr:VTT domain-containing protein [Actinoplanes sp. TBRC 11911]NMO51799.1 DedA family protein [Actinoplanes sp. TBRC 11911]
MSHYVDGIAASPWVFAVVFLVAGLDALLPFMPSETTVVACGVAAAGTGRPQVALLLLVAAAGAFAGDWLSFRVGRSGAKAVASNRRALALHSRVHRLLHSRGGLVIVFARYLPGGRSTTALAAGVVGYPAVRFAWYTAGGVLVWAAQASLLGYLGGAAFADRPLLGLLLAGSIAASVTGAGFLVQRRLGRKAPVTQVTK